MDEDAQPRQVSIKGTAHAPMGVRAFEGPYIGGFIGTQPHYVIDTWDFQLCKQYNEYWYFAF